MTDERGRVFRQAWIDGVNEFFPGEPKRSYITPWEETPDWEKDSATAVYDQLRQFIAVSEGSTAKLTSEQRGRFVAVCWTAQMYRHNSNPKPAYVADWADLPEWQQQTDIQIFDTIEQSLLEQGNSSDSSK